MAVTLERINSVPLQDDDFSFAFEQWLSIFVDTLNEVIADIQEELNRYENGLVAPQFTTAEITALAVNAQNGTIWYDTDTNQLKGKINSVVTVIA